MKRKVITLCLALVFSCATFAERPMAKGWDGSWKGKSYFVSPNAREHLGERWSPAKGEVPLSVTRAVSAARKSLGGLVGAIEPQFRCTQVKLCGIEPELDFWFYVVMFAVEETTKGGGKQRSVLPFVVYFDGFVIAPWPMSGPL